MEGLDSLRNGKFHFLCSRVYLNQTLYAMFKRFALLLTLGLFAVAANAQTQIEKGKFIIGGNGSLGFTSFGEQEVAGNTVDNSGSSVFNFGVNAGYFFINNLAAGLLLDFSSTSPDEGDDESLLGVGPFVRYYIPVAETFAFYPQASFQFVSGSEGDTDLSGTELGVGVGGAVFLGESVSLDLFLGYNLTTVDRETSGGDVEFSQNNFGANVGFNIFF
jgi:hypothetical protein